MYACIMQICSIVKPVIVPRTFVLIPFVPMRRLFVTAKARIYRVIPKREDETPAGKSNSRKKVSLSRRLPDLYCKLLLRMRGCFVSGVGTNANVGVCMCTCIYVCVFIELHIIAQFGHVILVILCHSH